MLAVVAESATVVKLLLKHHADANIHSFGASVPSFHDRHILHVLAKHSLCHQTMLTFPAAIPSTTVTSNNKGCTVHQKMHACHLGL